MRTAATCFVLISGCAFAQNAGVRPEFEVVDIKLNHSSDQLGAGSILPSGQFRAVNIPMKEILKFAFNLRDEAIIGAPGWIESERYDIIGKGPAVRLEETFWRSTSLVQTMTVTYNWDQNFRLMLQTMLADRFKLAQHEEQRPLNVFALVVAKNGPKLEKSTDSGRAECTRTVGEGVHAFAECTHMTMADLGKILQLFAPGYANRTVVDATGLEGAYDLKIDWVGRNNIDNGGLTLPDALDKQLGLKLEGRRQPMPVLVIDHVERPSEN